MKTTFYHERNKDIDIQIMIKLEDGKLSLEGSDYGPRVKEILKTMRSRNDESEFEYYLLLDKENTDRLFESLGIQRKTNRKKLKLIRNTFNKDKDISGLSNYCKKNKRVLKGFHVLGLFYNNTSKNFSSDCEELGSIAKFDDDETTSDFSVRFCSGYISSCR